MVVNSFFETITNTVIAKIDYERLAQLKSELEYYGGGVIPLMNVWLLAFRLVNKEGI